MVVFKNELAFWIFVCLCPLFNYFNDFPSPLVDYLSRDTVNFHLVYVYLNFWTYKTKDKHPIWYVLSILVIETLILFHRIYCVFVLDRGTDWETRTFSYFSKKILKMFLAIVNICNLLYVWMFLSEVASIWVALIPLFFGQSITLLIFLCNSLVIEDQSIFDQSKRK